MLAPIVLFVYARPLHTRIVIDALKKNKIAKDSSLIIYSDGAKNISLNDKVNEVRKYIREITGFKSVTIIERDRNYGLSRSIIEGVNEVLSRSDDVIVLEDDLVAAPYFLEYMNEGLKKYADNERVISIHGYVYPCKNKLPETFFIQGADCWGWGTWKRAWKLSNPDGKQLLEHLKSQNLTSYFNFNDAYSFTGMLEDQINNKNDSWAIRWNASAFLKGKLTLYPSQSLISNIGNDGSGYHQAKSSSFNSALIKRPIYLGEIDVIPSATGFISFQNYFLSIDKCYIKNYLTKIKKYLRKFIAL